MREERRLGSAWRATNAVWDSSPVASPLFFDVFVGLDDDVLGGLFVGEAPPAVVCTPGIEVESEKSADCGLDGERRLDDLALDDSAFGWPSLCDAQRKGLLRDEEGVLGPGEVA